MRLTLAILAGALIAVGQSFDVASIKPHPRDNFNTSFNDGPGRISWAGIAVRGLIMSAYDIESDQI